MKIRGRTLKAGDLRFQTESIGDVRSFEMLLVFVLAQKPRLITLDSGSLANLVSIQRYYWRAQDLEFLIRPKGKVDAQYLYHSGIHYLLARYFRKPLAQHPKFVLLCEAVTSMAEYYFHLEAYRAGGRTDYTQEFLEKLNKIKDELFPDRQEDVDVTRIFFSALADPFSAYREAVLEMFELYLFQMRLAIDRIENRKLKFKELTKKLNRLKYGPLICYFDLSSNILYAIANCGSTSSTGDLDAVKQLISILKQSDSLEEMLIKLGIQELKENVKQLRGTFL